MELEASPEAAAMLEKLVARDDLKSLPSLRIVAVKRVRTEHPGSASAGTEDAEKSAAESSSSA